MNDFNRMGYGLLIMVAVIVIISIVIVLTDFDYSKMDNSYEYIDLNNNEGQAVLCYETKGTLMCIDKDGAYKKVNEFRRIK